MPTYYYETFRTIGFPAVTKSHITLGLGYEFTKVFRSMWATPTALGNPSPEPAQP